MMTFIHNPDRVSNPVRVMYEGNEMKGSEENILYQITRYDQRNDDEFKCFAYKAIV